MTTKPKMLFARLNDEEARIVRLAVHASGKTVSQWMRQAAISAAMGDIEASLYRRRRISVEALELLEKSFGVEQ